MEIRYNVTGVKRKELVKVIANADVYKRQTQSCITSLATGDRGAVKISGTFMSGQPVSYTHLDVYKRQPLR